MDTFIQTLGISSNNLYEWFNVYGGSIHEKRTGNLIFLSLDSEIDFLSLTKLVWCALYT